MANETTDKQPTTEQPTDGPKGTPGLLPWIILAAVIPVFAGAGFGLGRLLAGGKPQPMAEANHPEAPEVSPLLNEQASAEKTWFYQCEPVIANLNEPGATRVVRMLFILELSGQFEEGKGRAYLDGKLPLIKNWLTIYLSSLSLSDVQGEKNLNRILVQIREGLNAKLFPDTKPLIKAVYFLENAIQ